MKKKDLRSAQPADERLYLRKTGDRIKGQYVYLYTDADGKKSGVVRGSDRDIAKLEVMKSEAAKDQALTSKFKTVRATATGIHLKFWR
jgi:hypothetical protein